MFLTLGESKPRVGRNVLLKVWDRFYLARFNGTRWVLPLSGEVIRADATDEWTGIR